MTPRATIFWSKGIRSLHDGNTEAGPGVATSPVSRDHLISPGHDEMLMERALHQTLVVCIVSKDSLLSLTLASTVLKKPSL